MNYYTDYINVRTVGPIEFVDITDEVKRIAAASGIRDGIVNVFTQHTTAAVKINEGCDRLQEDMIECLERIAPSKGRYKHNIDTVDQRPNGHSHLKSLFLNASEQVPIKNSEMLLGEWQRVFFIELDGPREGRRVVVSIIGGRFPAL